jgi:hypothetical protein
MNQCLIDFFFDGLHMEKTQRSRLFKEVLLTGPHPLFFIGMSHPADFSENERLSWFKNLFKNSL